MAPWPRAPVIPQLVDRKTFRDNRWDSAAWVTKWLWSWTRSRLCRIEVLKPGALENRVERLMYIKSVEAQSPPKHDVEVGRRVCLLLYRSRPWTVIQNYEVRHQ
ncbi:hypothetical protein TNCV_1779991 [Trichonephila clavipes]|nr:hypothetical protein TNCV_1779991 [Trichonephila clavipes]